MKLTLEQLKELSKLFGYRFEVDEDGIERMIRPDGSVAVTACYKKAEAH